MRHYLTAKTGEIPNVREVYTAFKAFARTIKGDTRDLVADIHAYAREPESVRYMDWGPNTEAQTADFRRRERDLDSQPVRSQNLGTQSTVSTFRAAKYMASR